MSLLVKFIRTLMEKWGVIEWLQFNAPTDFWYKLASCEFCQSFHIAVVLSIILAFTMRDAWFLTIPFFSSSLR